MTSRVYAYLVSVAVLAAMAYPVTWPLTRDSFPLSNFPMFSRPLPEPTVTIQYALGLEPGGARHHVPPQLVANREVLQARAVLARAVHQGRETTDTLCRAVAGRVAEAGPPWDRVTEVQIVTGTHDAVAYLTGQDTRGRERVHGRCRVPARAGQAP